MATSTPWGPSQSADKVATGIMFYTTAGHGGYHLSQKRMEAVNAKLPYFVNWAGDGWFEEDCEWAIVLLMFPEEFNEREVESARKLAKLMAERPIDTPGSYGDQWRDVCKAFDIEFTPKD